MSGVHVVTGGSGYFGSALVKKLRAHGHAVRVLDVNDADDRPSDVDFVRGDIRDRDAVARALDGAEIVHHNVALVPLAKDARAFVSVNEDGTRILLDLARERGVRKVVHMSSSAVFGIPRKNPVDDTVEPAPLEAYGRSKLAAERLCARAVERGLDVTIVRPRTIMGHGRLGIMQVVFEWIRTGHNVPVLGKGDNVYQFVHADDLADAVILAAARPGAATYNIGAAEFGTMRATLEGLVRHAATGSRVVSLPRRTAIAAMRATSMMRLSPLAPYHWLMYGESMYFDLTRPQRELGWTPKYGNVQMFCESYDFYVAHREEILRQKASSHRSAVRFGVLEVVGRGMDWL